MVSLLRTEGVLPGEVEEEENIHHNFALVERWREVSKVIDLVHCLGHVFDTSTLKIN